MDKKWLLGIFTTLCTGLILWWLTHEGGPLNPARPRLTIIDWTFPHEPFKTDAVAAWYKAEMIIANDGASTAEGCSVYDDRDVALSGFDKFGIPAKQSKTVSVVVFAAVPRRNPDSLFRVPRLVKSRAHVKCDNEVTSSPIERSIIVEPPP